MLWRKRCGRLAVSDLVEWLTKILNEDEETARAAQEVMRRNDGTTQLRTRDLLEQMPAAYQKFSYRWIAPRVLADIAAKQAIIELHQQGGTIPPHCWICQGSMPQGWAYPCETLRLLASAYADRSGYDESWRP